MLLTPLHLISSQLSSPTTYNDGWVLHPSEDYNHWAQRNRFQVNDTLYFRYKKGSDSVLIVTKDDFDSCNIKNPIKSLTDGNSTFVFDRSGPFFFISGNSDNCNNGQKLVIVVMAVRNKTHHHQQPSPAPSPVVVATPPASPSLVPEAPAGSPRPDWGPSGFGAPSPGPVDNNSGSTRLVGGRSGIVLGIIVLGFIGTILI
ncbi:early nodulin-like protein 1 [Carica papaya]|uniref:early nodulin-like protein 1 n=1 Tax=Carica papaya TaxID=3649 RepID=UPI000B8CE9DB|nr:early nodulin-like protein 1 [Carica papaya]